MTYSVFKEPAPDPRSTTNLHESSYVLNLGHSMYPQPPSSEVPSHRVYAFGDPLVDHRFSFISEQLARRKFVHVTPTLVLPSTRTWCQVILCSRSSRVKVNYIIIHASALPSREYRMYEEFPSMEVGYYVEGTGTKTHPSYTLYAYGDYRSRSSRVLESVQK